ncbi:MAG: COG4705 family protein [Acidimicrobiales bacterium]
MSLSKTWTERGLTKVPEITAFFWIIKALTTAMGEATSDYSVYAIDPVIAVLLGFIVFVIAMALQLRTRRYVAPVYWFAVVMVAVFGTMCADVLHVRFGVPYSVSSTGFAIVLAAVFVSWYLVEGTLSIHSVSTLRRELFYWSTVLATFALGTALGDMTATTLHLGYFSSGLMFAGLIALPALGYGFTRLNGILAFWAAYVITRPLGASFADWLGVPRSWGGLAWGRGNVGIIFAIPIVALVAYLTVSRVDIPADQRPAAATGAHFAGQDEEASEMAGETR